MKYIPLIIILLLILAILVLIFYGVYRVKRFSRQLFGTDDILQGVKKAQEDLSTTPRSVSAMTRIALPQIVSDFPDFEYNEMKQRAENALMQYFEAVTAQDVTILQEGNEDLKEQLRSQIRALVSQEKMNLVGTQFSEQLPAAQLHWMIADEKECIVVECMADGLHIYDNPAGVLTNNPPFPQQMFLLNQYMHLSPKQPVNALSLIHI